KESKKEKMLKVKVYADHMSQPSHAILIFCKVNGIEFDEIKVEISKRQQLSPKFAAINPFKKLPAIVNGRFKLFESHAILIYLASAFLGIADHCVRYLVVTSASLKLNGKSSSFQDVWCGPGIGLASDHASASVDCVVARKNASSRRNLDAPLLFLNSMTVLDCLIDQRLYIGLPDAKQRVQVFGVHSSGKQLAEDVDFEKLVFRTVGFSGADIRNLVNEAAIMMVRKGHSKISQQDIVDVLDKQLLEGEKNRFFRANTKQTILISKIKHSFALVALMEFHYQLGGACGYAKTEYNICFFIFFKACDTTARTHRFATSGRSETVRATLDAVEEVIEERDLDPLFSERYTLFWIMLLLSKLAFSYYVE
ncbi:hypothetical protein S245_051232, partial [Arachis hypogaea]